MCIRDRDDGLLGGVFHLGERPFELPNVKIGEAEAVVVVIPQQLPAVFQGFLEKPKPFRVGHPVDEATPQRVGGDPFLPILPSDVHTDLVAEGNLLYQFLEMLIVYILHNGVGALFHRADFDVFVKAVQKDHLEQPEQHQQDGAEADEHCKDLPFDAGVVKPLFDCRNTHIRGTFYKRKDAS